MINFSEALKLNGNTLSYDIILCAFYNFKSKLCKKCWFRWSHISNYSKSCSAMTKLPTVKFRVSWYDQKCTRLKVVYNPILISIQPNSLGIK